MNDNTKFKKVDYPNSKNYWITILIAIPLIFLTIILWWFFHLQDQNNQYKRVQLEVVNLSTYIKKDLDNRILALNRLVFRWETRKGTPKEEFEKDAQNYITDMPGFQAIEWVDRDYQIRWIIPLKGNEQAQGLNVKFEESRRRALEKAKNNSGATFSSVVDLVQGGKGILIYFPLFIDGKFDGFLLAVFKIEEWFNLVILANDNLDESKNFNIEIEIDDALIYDKHSYTLEKENNPRYNYSKTFFIKERKFTIFCSPTDEFIEKNTSSLPFFVATFGFLMTTLISYSVFLFLKASNETWKANTIMNDLENEIIERKQIESNLHETSFTLNLATKAGQVGIWSWDISTNKLVWNNLMYSLYDLSPEITLNFDVWKRSLHQEDAESAVQLIQNAVNGTAVFDTEFRIVLPDGTIRYLHAAAKVERNYLGEPQKMVGVNWDISDLKKKEKKLKTQAEFQELLINTSLKYINISLENVEKDIQIALYEIGTYVNADRVYIFNYNFEKFTASASYKWCREGISCPLDNLKEISLEQMHTMLEYHRQDKILSIENISTETDSVLKTLLISHGVKTLITIPMLSENSLYGFLAFEWTQDFYNYSNEEFQLLKIFSQLLMNIQLRQKSEKELIETKNRFDLAIKGTNAGLWDWSVQTGKTIFNERWAEIIGYTLKELEPINIDTWIKYCNPEDLKESEKLLTEHFEGKSKYYSFECRMKHKNGDWVWVHDRGQVVEWDSEGKPLRMLGTHIDISERKKTDELIRHLANHDSLTNLPTMRLAKDRAYIAIQIARRNKETAAFMFLDLDGFKSINDTYGHDAGDELLRQVAKRFLNSVRQIDTVARIGGDEFFIILNEIKEKHDVEEIAKKIITEISTPFIIDDIPVEVGVSIGISIYPRDGKKIDELIKQADTAMYKIKKSGKNGFAFFSN